MNKQPRSSGIPNQAVFIRDSFLSMLKTHEDASHPADPELQSLLKNMNHFFEENALEPIDFPRDASVSESFGGALVQFFNEINHYPNPINLEMLPVLAPEREDANRTLSEFYYSVSEYLHATHVPITRKGITVIPDRKPEPFIKLWRRVLDKQDDGSYFARIEEVDHIDPDKKAVICVGGAASIHGHEPSINGLMKIAEAKLGGPEIYEDGLELYCVSYPAAHRPSFFAQTHHYNLDPEHHYSEPAKQFADRLILPEVDKLTHPNPEHLGDVFSKLNLFAYSYGTVFVQEVRNYLSESLRERGYDAAQVRDAFAEAYAMNIGPTCRLDVKKETGNFSSVYVISPNDLNVRSKTHNHVLVNALERTGKRMKPISENELIIYSDAPQEGTLIDYSNPHPTPKASPDGDVRVKKNPSCHDLSFYTESTALPDGTPHVPRYLSYLMSSAVGTRGAYQEIDERFLPAQPTADAGNLKIGSRMVKDVYQLYLLDGITDERSTKER